MDTCRPVTPPRTDPGGLNYPTGPSLLVVNNRSIAQRQPLRQEAAMRAACMRAKDIRKATMGEWRNLANSVDAYPSGDLTTGKYSGVSEGVPCD